MKTLIIKLSATGDVVRTTCLLRRLNGEVTWLTAPMNVPLLEGVSRSLRSIAWDNRETALDENYDLLINLEDDPEPAAFARRVRHKQRFGAYLDDRDQMAYTDDARLWFDMSLISVRGRKCADELKLRNRRTYQALIFEGLGLDFCGEPYVLPEPTPTDLVGDVAITPVAGPVWPMKGWAYYDRLQQELAERGLRVNVLPHRQSLLLHMGDIKNHRCLVSGDSLPMHLALGLKVACVTIFNCTSPWEIHDYGIQTKVVSPLLAEFFYKRGLDQRATQAIALGGVLRAVLNSLSRQPRAASTVTR